MAYKYKREYETLLISKPKQKFEKLKKRLIKRARASIMQNFVNERQQQPQQLKSFASNKKNKIHNYAQINSRQ
jgi:hypothetical protein